MDRAGPPLRAHVADATVVPANQASWEDLRAIFGNRGYAAYCQCQKLKFKNWAERHATPVAVRMKRLEAQTQCGYPSANTTSGLVAYLDGNPVGWCAVEPRTAFPRLRNSPVPWRLTSAKPASAPTLRRLVMRIDF